VTVSVKLRWVLLSVYGDGDWFNEMPFPEIEMIGEFLVVFFWYREPPVKEGVTRDYIE